MKTILAFAFLCVLVAPTVALADTYVHGYTKSNGTYVEPHYRSDPDGDVNNNWSTKGNVNPYTGQEGTRNPEPTYQPYGNSYQGNSLSGNSDGDNSNSDNGYHPLGQ